MGMHFFFKKLNHLEKTNLNYNLETEIFKFNENDEIVESDIEVSFKNKIFENFNNLKTNNFAKINKIQQDLQNDEKNYIRKEFMIILWNKFEINANFDTQQKQEPHYKEKIKTRHLVSINETVDLENLKNNVSPSTNHADDAGSLFKGVEGLRTYNIPCSVIHDAIGTPLWASTISKIEYKKSTIYYAKYLIENEKAFPFNILNNEFKNFNKNIKENGLNLNEEREKFIKERNENRIKFKNNFDNLKKNIYDSKDFFN